MALETSHVRCTPGRNVAGDSSARRCVAGRTVNPRVPRMIEFGTEASQSGEALHCTRLCVRVTYRADRAPLIGELERVTPGARQVIRFAGKADARRIVIASMAYKAWESRMILIAVCEPGIINGLSWFSRLCRHDLAARHGQGFGR